MAKAAQSSSDTKDTEALDRYTAETGAGPETSVIETKEPTQPSVVGPMVPTPMPNYIRRYLAGESIQVIAKDEGVHRATLYRHMFRDLGEQHDDVVTDMLIGRIAEADDKLERAGDACDIARAREQARFARMDLERRRPHLYGQRPTTSVNVSGQGVTVNLVSYLQHDATQQNGDVDK